MKTLLALSRAATLAAAASLCLTCLAGTASGLVLDPVGPQPASSKSISASGTLVVLSAASAHAPDLQGPDYARQHTSYRIVKADGAALETVANRAGAWGQDAETVALPAGTYKVLARANGYGEVTVPVVIVAGRTTEVNLVDGLQAASPDGLVRLPDGRSVGWKAQGR